MRIAIRTKVLRSHDFVNKKQEYESHILLSYNTKFAFEIFYLWKALTKISLETLDLNNLPVDKVKHSIQSKRLTSQI